MENRPQAVQFEELAKVYREIAGRAVNLLSNFAKKWPQSGAVGDELGIAKAYMEFYSRILADPIALTAQSTKIWADYARLWRTGWMRVLGQEVAPIAVPAETDSRFKDGGWTNTFLFDFIKQSYLIASHHMQQAVSGVEGLSDESQ